jgi:hypothetical protein
MAKKKIEIPEGQPIPSDMLPHDETKSLRVEPFNNAYVVMFGDSYASKSGQICELPIDAHFYPTKVKAQQAVDFLTRNPDYLIF